MAAKGSRRLHDKLDKFNPLMCCDEYIKKGYNPYITSYKRDFYYTNNHYHFTEGADYNLRYKLRDGGLYPSTLLVGSPSHRAREHNYNTQYTEDFNKTYRQNILPPSRFFNFYKGENGRWEPEKSDHPMIGEPYSHGYTEHKRGQWRKEREEMVRFIAKHEYKPESLKYSRYNIENYKDSKRYATPLVISSKSFNPKQVLTRGPPPLLQPNESQNIPSKHHYR